MGRTRQECLPLIEKYRKIQEEFREMSGKRIRDWVLPRE